MDRGHHLVSRRAPACHGCVRHDPLQRVSGGVAELENELVRNISAPDELRRLTLTMARVARRLLIRLLKPTDPLWSPASSLPSLLRRAAARCAAACAGRRCTGGCCRGAWRFRGRARARPLLASGRPRGGGGGLGGAASGTRLRRATALAAARGSGRSRAGLRLAGGRRVGGWGEWRARWW